MRSCVMCNFHSFQAEMLLSLVTNVMSCSPSPLLSRLDSEDDQEPEKLQHFHDKTDTAAPAEGHNDSTKAEEPNTSQLGQTECKRHMEEDKSVRMPCWMSLLFFF